MDSFPFSLSSFFSTSSSPHPVQSPSLVYSNTPNPAQQQTPSTLFSPFLSSPPTPFIPHNKHQTTVTTTTTTSFTEHPSLLLIFPKAPFRPPFFTKTSASTTAAKMGDIPRVTDPPITTEAPPPPKPTIPENPTTTKKTTTTTTTTEKPTFATSSINLPVTPIPTGTNKGPAESHSIIPSPSLPLSSHVPGTEPNPPPASSFAALPASKGDEALFGRTATVGGFNMTAGILIFGSFMVLFVAAVGFATMHRVKTRRAFRLRQMAMQENGKGDDGESGAGRSLPRGLVGGIGGSGKEEGRYMDEDLKLEFGDDDDDDAGAARKEAYTAAPDRKYTYPDREALYKNASMSRKALMSDAAPTGTSPPLGASLMNEDTPSVRAAKRASSASTASTASTRSKRLSSAQTYDIFTSGSRGGVTAAAVAALDRPKAAISNPVVRFEETDSTTGSILISRPRPASNSSSLISSSDIDEMTSYSPEPVHLIVFDEDTDSQSDYSSSPPYHIPKVTVAPQAPNSAYQSRGQQGYLNPTQSSTLQQKRQSPPPPPKSLKRLSPVSTTALAKNFQQAQTIASTAKLGPTKTSTVPTTSTAPLARSNTLRTGFTPTPRGANSNGLKRSSSSSAASITSSLASSRTGRSGNIYYNASHYGRNEFSPAERKATAAEELQYPTAILRSNSVRLPIEMRTGGTGATTTTTTTTAAAAGYNSNDANNYF